MLSEDTFTHYHSVKPDHRLPSPLATSSAYRPDLSRASSASSQTSTSLANHQVYHLDRVPSFNFSEQNKTTLPGLSQIAAMATTPSQNRSYSATHAPMAYHHAMSPIPTPGIAGMIGGAPPVCQNCQTSTTPLWRRDESGSVLCNACGLFLKLHGRPRPISLKTDVIKSRNRVKANQPLKKKLENGLPATQSADMITPQNRRISHMASAGSERSQSPISRTGTPGVHDSNIAPQHMFDNVHMGDQPSAGSPSLPPLNHSFGLSPNTLNGLDFGNLVANNENLRTRVSELEVINMVYSDNENNLRSERDKAVQERDDLKRRVEELEQQLKEATDMSHPSKKAKLSLDDRSNDTPTDS